MIDIYLLWVPNDGWGVYVDNMCPDPGAFPAHIYRKYSVSNSNLDIAFRNLINIRNTFSEKKIYPTRENQDRIFPKLEEILKE